MSTAHAPDRLAPGATIGILGGGQLGRMLAMAAAKLGLKCHVYAPEPDSAAFEVVRRVTLAEYGDENALDRFARDVDVVTYEFENVPSEVATFLNSRRPVLPAPRVLATTQDRLVEKTFVAGLGIATAPFASADTVTQTAAALAEIGRPAVLKTRRFGYDGKGQATVWADTDLDAAWQQIGGRPAVVERFIDFEREISVLAARDRDGHVVCFEVTENEHRDHVLKISRVPADIPAELGVEARRIAEKIAGALDYVGVLAVEMFVVKDADARTVLVNEIAPRVHNSGHWTLDGASVSQFEQHIRAIAGWPLAKPRRRGRIEMINLIGAEVEDYARWLKVDGAAVHLYGKANMRPGRKMGHVTRVFGDASEPDRSPRPHRRKG
ncbi:MAG TPA: 5-(carboxyamino)imidazole ribonucleotide synthase [Xanthobacteraceae bacterium]|nr:5-(carboxyamino)imidazole ribonucleotide synthase [Xanthobacteraceae bacterium]